MAYRRRAPTGSAFTWLTRQLPLAKTNPDPKIRSDNLGPIIPGFIAITLAYDCQAKDGKKRHCHARRFPAIQRRHHRANFHENTPRRNALSVLSDATIVFDALVKFLIQGSGGPLRPLQSGPVRVHVSLDR